MSSNIDFKAIWQQQDVVAKPDVKEITKRSGQLRRKVRNKLLWVNGILVLATAYYIFLGFGIHTAVTTRIGAALVILGFVAYLLVSTGLLLSLFKSHPEADSFAYLTELLAIRKKQEFIQTKVMRLYMLVLSAGISLCMIDPAKKMGVLWGSIAYIVLVAWMSFVYLYLKPRKLKKEQAEFNTVIEKLQAINNQLLLIKDME
jgi:hypothetical protein